MILTGKTHLQIRFKYEYRDEKSMNMKMYVMDTLNQLFAEAAVQSCS